MVWERELDPPNTIIDVAQGVIVASDTWSRGAVTGVTGAWGLSVEHGKVLCESGAVLDIQSGELIDHREPPEQWDRVPREDAERNTASKTQQTITS